MSGTIGHLVSLSYANFVLPETGSCVSPRSQLTVASGAAAASLMLPWWSLFQSVNGYLEPGSKDAYPPVMYSLGQPEWPQGERVV